MKHVKAEEQGNTAPTGLMSVNLSNTFIKGNFLTMSKCISSLQLLKTEAK